MAGWPFATPCCCWCYWVRVWESVTGAQSLLRLELPLLRSCLPALGPMINGPAILDAVAAAAVAAAALTACWLHAGVHSGNAAAAPLTDIFLNTMAQCLEASLE